jgi:uncharacterized protein (TIGR04255 family)
VDRPNKRFILERPPLVYAVAQIKFSGIGRLSTHIPDIQDEMRKAGFPRCTEGQVTTIQLGSPADTMISPRWEFLNRDRTAGVALLKDAVAFHVSRYIGFDEFCTHLRTALKIVQNSLGIELVERIGLRYVDVVLPEPRDGFASLVNPVLLGLDDKALGARESSCFVNYIAQTEVGTLCVRALRRSDGGFLPPDLQLQQSLVFAVPTIVPGQSVLTLDLDHFQDLEKESHEFSEEDILKRLWLLHDNLTSAFLSAVTPAALAAWGMKERT